jgi:hypothetical protein
MLSAPFRSFVPFLLFLFRILESQLYIGVHSKGG